jgi:proline iminopeptidase
MPLLPTFPLSGGWMRDGQLLEKQSIDLIRHIPTKVAQGRYDVVCPPRSAWDLKKAFPEVRDEPLSFPCAR